METAAWQWAREQFGEADLGDRRRVDRLVRLAARAAASPAGTVTSVVPTSAEQEGAFRLLESSKVSAQAVADASHVATLRRCSAQRWVYVAVDGSSVSLTDRVCGRDIGHVGPWRHPARGLIVQSALAVASDGTPVGVAGQVWWARTERARPAGKRKPKYFPPEKTELRHTLSLLQQVHAGFAAHAPGTQPWYQFDRYYDAWAVLKLAHEQQMRMTVRVAHERCVREDSEAKKKYLFSCISRAPLLGHHRLHLPARKGRPARIATLEVRACQVTLELPIARKRRLYVPMFVVSVKERTRNNPLHWTLLTTVPVHSLSEALTVTEGYASRWRIEEFHRAWKDGVCHVEDTQLRGRETIIKWATILAAVAARATRLSHLARESADIAATEELSRWEIDAAIALLRPKGIKLGATPTLAQVVGWIAELGGFAGKYSGKPPGPTVIGRGLEKVQAVALALQHLREMR